MSRNDIMAFIGANARGFHDAMSRVRSDTKATASSSQREFSQLSAGLNRSMSLVKGALAGVGIGLSVQGIKQIVSDIAGVEFAAKRAGLSIKSFQQMKYVAETNRIEVGAMSDAFRELTLRASEYAQTGKGAGAQAFAQLGMSPAEVKQRLKDPADLMLEIIDRTRRLKDTASGINLFDKMLGGQGGEQFVSLIEQGRDRLTETIKEGEELGRVLSDDVVNAAADVDKKFQDLASTVTHSLKAAIVDAYQALQVFVSSFSVMEERSGAALRANQQQLNTRRKQLEEQKGSFEDTYLLSPFGKDAATELVEVDKQLKTINDELERRNKLTSITNTDIPPPVTPYILPSDKKTKGSGTRAAKITDAEREKKAIDDLIASLEEELALVGLSDEARDKEIALRKAGASASLEQRDQIIGLVEARYREQKAVEAVEEQLRRNADAALDLADISMNMIDTIIDGSFSAKDALAGLLRQMAQALLMGQGPLANLFGISPQSSGLGGMFGMMFGGARAAGGSVTPGNLYRVNEKGEEFFSPGTHGRIIPHDGASGGGISFAPVYQIDARGADQAAVTRIEAGLKQTNAELSARVIETIRNAQNSNVKLG
ncbi:hypothetical protein [Pseudochrobactrum sp. MP213Fo]|uniref:hypothetical protein n=1 Tax=Pseudochrobactrum sp. MP213Fo TaxID=3022250 RepID=UPI003BA2C2B0